MRAVFTHRVGEVRRMGLYPDEYAAMTTYNSERYRGLVHDPEYREQMAELQSRFDREMRGDAPEE